MTILAAIAATFGVLMGVAPLLQLRRILKVRSSWDVSPGLFTVAAVGQFTWVVYGITLHNAAVVASNGAGMLANTAVLTVVIWARRRWQPDGIPVTETS